MNDQDKEDYGRLFSKYTEISENFSESGKSKHSSKKGNKKQSDDDKTFGDFVLMMDNKEEYKKMVLGKAKTKVWRAIHSIKNKKNVRELLKDSSTTKWYIINPDQNKYKPFFDTIFYILLYIDFLFSPFEYFVYQGDYKTYRVIIFDVFFALEIFSHFFTSYYDSKNKFYVTDIKKICINYLKGQFIVSFLYVFPFYILYSKLEIFRLIKLYQYPNVNNKIKKFTTWLLSFCIKNITICSQIVRVFTFFLSICYITHICACIYCYLGLTFDDSWIYQHSDLIDTSSVLDIYVSSYYFITETLSSTGYGDLTPNNYAEMLFIMFCQIITCGLYAYLLSNILDILLNKDNSDSYKYRANQLNLESWIMYYMKKLPASSKNDNLHRNKIWDETKKYFELYYNPTKNLNWIKDKNFIEQMKPSHRNQLMITAFGPLLNKFFSFFNKIKLVSTKIKIIMNFKTSIQVSKTELNFKWKKIHKIYFIDTGIVDIYKNGELWYSINEGSYFGIESLLKNKDNNENITYKVSDDCPYVILYTIDIPFLVDEILNYDEESFTSVIYLANYYIKNVLNKGNEKNNFHKISLNDNIDIANENIINTNINNEINDDMINLNKNENIDKDDGDKEPKINLDLINPGCLPELDKKIEEYEKAEKVIDESNLKVELMDKQINFINKYIDKIKVNKKF